MSASGLQSAERIAHEWPTSSADVAAELRNAMVMVANAIEDLRDRNYDEDYLATDLGSALTHVLAVADALHPGGRR